MSRTPVLILFQKITRATVRKALNESADATSGGGARDLRLPYIGMRPFMEQMLPQTRNKLSRGVEVTVRYGIATWDDGSQQREIEYWPPTQARPGEGRIATISSLPPLANPPSDLDGAVVLFVKDEDGLIWVRYATAQGLRKSMPEVGEVIRECLARRRRPRRIATGYMDLTPGGLGNWCNSSLTEDDV